MRAKSRGIITSGLIRSMEYVFITMYSFAILAMFVCIYMMKRNGDVATFRREILEMIHEAAVEAQDLDFEWRYDMYSEVSYNDMMWPPFRKLTLKSYYKDLSFLDSKAKNPNNG